MGYHAAIFGGLLPGLGLLATAFATNKGKPVTRKRILSTRTFGFLLVIALFSLMVVGCGSGGNPNGQTPAAGSQVTLTVTGTSGGITQSAPVTITIN